MKNNYKWPRLLMVLAAFLLAGAFILPIWQIQLTAPQYPEGLTLKIYAKGLFGDVEVINGLNHYIGMQTLHNEDFIEFMLLPYLIATLVLLGLITAYINRKKVYYAYTGFFMFVAILSMADFYRWEYNYGHHLDPNAPIQVPGMSYQPPLIGYKQLLNFGAYSIPDVGGWLFIGAGVLIFVVYLLIVQPRWFTYKRKQVAFIVGIISMLQSCTAGPAPIKYGSDACAFCKMTIMEKKFANEWVTDKGKVFSFDDVHCLLSYVKEHNGDGTAYINDFNGNKEFIKANEMSFVRSEQISSPMGGHIAAFADVTAADEFAKKINGRRLSWQQLEKESANR